MESFDFLALFRQSFMLKFAGIDTIGWKEYRLYAGQLYHLNERQCKLLAIALAREFPNDFTITNKGLVLKQRVIA